MKSLLAVMAVMLVVLTIAVIATGCRQKPERPEMNLKTEEILSPDREQYRFARLITAYELTKLHLAALEERRSQLLPPTPEEVVKARETSRYIADQMLAEPKVGVEWKVSIIRPTDRNGKSLNEFEKRAIERIQHGAEEVGERAPSGAVRYARPVRMKENCAVCHQRPANSRGLDAGLSGKPELPKMEVGDVIATFSLEITFQDSPGTERAGRAANRGEPTHGPQGPSESAGPPTPKPEVRD